MGRKSKSIRLTVFLEEVPVGVLDRTASGDLSFTYVSTWLDHAESSPISYSLKIRQQPYHGEIVRAYFENLLPDNESIRKAIAARTGAASTEGIDLLAALGRDCVGALQFFPAAHERHFTKKLKTRALSEGEIARRLRSLEKIPLGVSSSDEFRISIAGAQEKTALLWNRGKWCLPLEATPTSHIFKVRLGRLPNGIDLSTSIENEWLCLKVAEHFGLPVAKASIGRFGDTDCLIVERFDRQWTLGKKMLKRLPQEDLCQALGIPSTKKYESEGGPGISQIMEFLDASDIRNQDRETFLRSQIVFFLIGATDGHAKNFSISIRKGGFRLTPLYDILSVADALNKRQLERKDAKLAMCVGDNRHYRLNEIHYRHWQQTAKKCGFSLLLLDDLMHDLTNRIKTLQDILSRLPKDFPEDFASTMLKFVLRQAKQLGG